MKQETHNWLQLAEEDLKVAKILLREGIYNHVCFHSQQCAEKSLKALIEEKSKIPKEHRLLKLFRICKELGYDLEPYRGHMEFLDKFYTSTRYPFIIGMLPTGIPSQGDAETALEFAEAIYSLVFKILELDNA